MIFSQLAYFKSKIGRYQIFNSGLPTLIRRRVVLVSFNNLFFLFPSFEIMGTNYSYHQKQPSLKAHNKNKERGSDL